MTWSYLELKQKSVCSEKLVNLIPDLNFSLIYGQIEATYIDVDLLREDKDVYNLIKHFKVDVNRKSAIYRFEPLSSYVWHIDSIRNCSINLLLIGPDSKTLFGNRKGMYYKDLEIVPYNKDTYYLLNTSKYHSVYNFSKNYRYLLSLGISKEWTVEEVKEHIEKHDLRIY